MNHYMSIGCPIEAGVTDINGRSGLIVEKCCGEQFFLSQAQAELWTSLLICGTNENQQTELKQLYEMGLLIIADTPASLMEQLSQMRPIRHGVGIMGKDRNDKKVFCISLGESKYSVNKIQRLFWRWSDGDKKISEIIEIIRANGISIDDKLLYTSVRQLINIGAVYLRR